MKQRLTPEQLQEIPASSLLRLQEWWRCGIEYDDTVVAVHIVEEQSTYVGRWDQEYAFNYPEEYTGKLKNHRGTMLPRLSIGELLQFIDEHMRVGWWHLIREEDHRSWQVMAKFNSFEVHTVLIDTLWAVVKDVLDAEAHDESL